MIKRSLFNILYESILNPSTPRNQLEYVTQELNDANIDYCVIGGLALIPHNYIRNTDDIDILVSKESFSRIESELIGLGFRYRTRSSKRLLWYITASNAKIQIEILVEGDNNHGFLMPDPKEVRQKIGGIWYLSLKNLITFKLEASKSKERAGRDLVDVKKLIEQNGLNQSYAKKLNLDLANIFLSLFDE